MKKLTIAAIALIVMASCEKSEIAPVVEDTPMGKEVNDKIDLPRVKSTLVELTCSATL